MIQLRINNEADLYHRLDPTRTRISEEVYNYLRTFCTEMEAKKHIHDTLQIISDEPVDAERFKRVILNTLHRDQAEFDLQIATNKKRALGGFVLGIALSVAGFTLSLLLDRVLLAMISFFGSMFIRDAVVIWTKVIPDIRRLKKLLEPFCEFNLEVIVNGKKEFPSS